MFLQSVIYISQPLIFYFESVNLSKILTLGGKNAYSQSISEYYLDKFV